MKCYSCGRTIEDGSKVCPYCKKEQGISRELFESARSGDQRACEQIYNRCYWNVYYTVKSMIKDEDTIQDLVQDTFVQAFRSLDSMEYMEGKFQAWIRRIAHNNTVNYTKKKKPILFSEMETDDEEGALDFEDEREENMPEAVIDQNETSRLIQEILNTLSEEQRLAVGMFYYEQYSVREIADIMGVSEGTIKSRLNYGRKKIEEKVRELEKKGTKLYGLSPIPFLLLLFRMQSAGTSEAPNASTWQMIQKALSTAHKGGAAAGKVGAAAGKAGEAASKTGAVAAKGMGLKVAAGIVAVGILGGGAAYAIANGGSREAVAVLETESQVSVETESEAETYSEIETESETETETQEVLVIEGSSIMMADVPDNDAQATVLGNADLLRSEVSSIIFLSFEEGVQTASADWEANAWDVSEDGDGSVMAYAMETEDGSYTLYIISSGGVYANEDSSYLFAYYSTATSIEWNDLFYTEHVTDMSSMFEGCTALVSLDLSGFDTSNVEYMTYMFRSCSSLATLDVSGFQTEMITDMSYLFEECEALTSLDLEDFDTSNVTDISYMFEGCKSLESLNIASFDTSQVTTMVSVFEECESLQSLNLSSFDTAIVENMENMFRDCASLRELDLTSFNTSNVGNMNGMFCGCESLVSLDLSSFDTSKVGDMSEMFLNCSSLSVDLSGFDMSNISNTNNMVEGCGSVIGLEEWR